MAMDNEHDLSHDEALERGIRALKILGTRIDEAHNISDDSNDNRLIWANNLLEQPPNLDRKNGARTVSLRVRLVAISDELYGAAVFCH